MNQKANITQPFVKKKMEMSQKFQEVYLLTKYTKCSR